MVVSEQKGVYRVNCYDCLDRTNVFQAKVAQKIVENSYPQIYNAENGNKAAKLLFQLWTISGDFISKYYAGSCLAL